MKLRAWVLALALVGGALGAGQAEPLRVAQVYAAGTTIDAPTLGFRLTVPPGYQAELGPSEDAPGVALNLRGLEGRSTIIISVLPNAPANALRTAFPAKLKLGQQEAVLTAPPTRAEVQVARYRLPGGGVLTRTATVQTVSGGTPTRVTVMLPHSPDQSEAAVQVLSAVLRSTVLIPADPVPAQVWATRLKVAQGVAFESIRRTSGVPTVFMGLCAGGGYALSIKGSAEGGFQAGLKGQVTAVPLSAKAVALKLTNAWGTSLGVIELNEETPQYTEMSLQLNAPPTDDDYLILRSANTEATHQLTGISLWCSTPGR
ncbi:hypothetical protein E7T06_07805 [Deinococcus sp. Arct2-2]|uniref:hypothetical protein n=1 Tax=Deinococcus sp. Arct2-2 TaxID=2568653 RepID=UPI0010A2AD01|nr:hypothetical protein [Deinococcus sp. Arct2-2]THF70362.1 hypothetical protein E7T06_07805 [Deinococcus sp. Arct2-2]